MLKGELGQPDNGWPKEFQKLVLKDEAPFIDLPNKHLKPVDFDAELIEFKHKFNANLPLTEFLSYKFYSKVFEDYFKNTEKWGNISALPSTVFFYGLKPNEEILVNLARGKTLLIKFLYKTEPDENGYRSVYFKLNGQTRAIDIKDNSVKTKTDKKPKAIGEKQIGASLPGLVNKIWVKQGDKIKANQPLFTIEAMKMENTIVANRDGIIEQLNISEGTLVELNDLIITLS